MTDPKMKTKNQGDKQTPKRACRDSDIPIANVESKSTNDENSHMSDAQGDNEERAGDQSNEMDTRQVNDEEDPAAPDEPDPEEDSPAQPSPSGSPSPPGSPLNQPLPCQDNWSLKRISANKAAPYQFNVISPQEAILHITRGAEIDLYILVPF